MPVSILNEDRCRSGILVGGSGETTKATGGGEVMTIQIELTAIAESGLATLARMKGLPLNEYVQGLMESLAIPGVPEPGGMTPEQRADALRHWVEQFPYRRKTPLPDEAISRENVYDRASNE